MSADNKSLYEILVDRTDEILESTKPQEFIDQIFQQWILQTPSADGPQAFNDVTAPQAKRLRLGGPCGHMFRTGEPTYRCLTCGVDETCVLCATCFHSSHDELQDHDIDMHISSGVGGCCDCGDAEAWKVPIKCREHGVAPEDAPSLSEPVVARFREGMVEMLDYVLDTWIMAPQRTVLSTELRRHPAMIGQAERVVLAEQRAKGVAEPLWELWLWNDERHSFHDVTDAVINILKCSSTQALAIAKAVDTHGRCHVLARERLEAVLDATGPFDEIMLTYSVRPVSEGRRERVCSELVAWLASEDARLSPLGLAARRTALCAAFLRTPQWRRLRGEDETLPQTLHGMFRRTLTSTISFMLAVEDRLPKAARISLRALTLQALGSAPVRSEVASYFKHAYSQIMFRALTRDAEPHLSTLNLSVQLLTVPSIARDVFEGEGSITPFIRLAEMLMSSHWTRLSSAAEFEDAVSEVPDTPVSIARQSLSLEREPQYVQAMHDLEFVLTSPGLSTAQVAASLVAMPGPKAIGANVLRMVACAQDMDQQLRKTDVHVRYESTTWVSAFNLSLRLGELLKAVAMPFGKTDGAPYAAEFLQRTIHYAAAVYQLKLGNVPAPWRDRLDTLTGPLPPDGQTGWSYHHPLQWLAAGVCRVYAQHLRACAGSTDLLVQIVHSALFRPFGRSGAPPLMLIFRVLDHSVQALALAAQTRAQLWVRNGLCMREQMQHYRHLALREVALDQDLFLLQMYVVGGDEDTCHVPLCILLARMGSLAWFRRWRALPIANLQPADFEPAGSVSDKQKLALAVETLRILVHAYTNRDRLLGASDDHLLEREVVHRLAQGPAAYSHLRGLCGSLATDSALDAVLQRVARLEIDAASGGKYHLCDTDANWALLDPYYYRLDNSAGAVASFGASCTPLRAPPSRPAAPAVSEVGTALARMALAPLFAEVCAAGLWHFCTSSPSDAVATATVDIAHACLWLVLAAQGDHGVSWMLQSHVDPAGIAEVEDDTANRPASLAEVVLQMCLKLREPSFSSTSVELRRMLDLAVEPLLSRAELQSHPVVQKLAATRNGSGAMNDIPCALEESAEAQGSATGAAKDLHDKPESVAERKKRLAKERKALLLAQMEQQQQAFLNATGNDEAMPTVNEQQTAAESETNAAQGDQVTSSTGSWDGCESTCIVCQEPAMPLDKIAAASQKDRMAVTLGFCRYVRLLQRAGPEAPAPETGAEPILRRLGSSECEFRAATFKSCGHTMHYECFSQYLDSIRERQERQPHRLHPERWIAHEFLCPFCKTLGNAVVPMLCEDVVEPVLVWPGASDPVNPPFREMRRGGALSERLAYFEGAQDATRLLANVVKSDMLDWLNSSEESEEASSGLEVMLDLEPTPAGDSPAVTDAETRNVNDQCRLALLQGLLDTASIAEVQLRQESCVGQTGGSGPSAGTQRFLRHIGNAAHALAIGGRCGPRWATATTPTPDALGLMSPGQLEQLVYSRGARHVVALLAVALVPGNGQLGSLAQAMLALEVLRVFLVVGRDDDGGAVLDCGPETTAQFASTPDEIDAASRFYTLAGCPAPPERVLRRLQLSKASVLVEMRSLACLLSWMYRPAPGQNWHPEPCLTSDSQWSFYCALFGLAPLAATLQSPPRVFSEWIQVGSVPRPLARSGAYGLVELPTRLTELLERGLAVPCRHCNSVPSDPVICLQCGTLLCAQGLCCRNMALDEGECSAHVAQCNGLFGMFFSLKQVSVLLLYGDNGCYIPAPYRDLHGESDFSHAHGRPMTLVPEKRDELERMLLYQEVPSKVIQRSDSRFMLDFWRSF